MIQDIVVKLNTTQSRDPSLDYAVSVAEAFDAKLAGIAFRYEPVMVGGSAMEALPPDFIEQQRVENERVASDAVARFTKAAQKSGLTATPRVVNVSAEGAANEFGRIARTFDLSVVAQADPDANAADEIFVESALMDSGRPVIVVPYIQKTGLALKHAVICWDGSRTAARALADAMPFLERARNIEILSIAKDKHHRGEGAAEAARHLARHGLKAEITHIVADGDVANTILSHVADAEADFLVLGGYGHSRLRELILGGVTRSILTSMTVPVLMSH